jgi:ubiquitin carboxyl-terminal hydrolase 12/46
LLNISAERNNQQGKGKSQIPVDALNSQPEPTWVHEIFQGIMTSETRCLNCETVSSLLLFCFKYIKINFLPQVSSKDEHFFDLQVDVEQNTNINHSLRCFSNTEILCSDNKFKCDNCRSYQEAQVKSINFLIFSS